MTTKLVVTVDGLLLTDQNTVVASRSIDEVVLVNTVSGFNALTAEQRSNVISRKNNNIGSASLSVAFADETSGTLSDDFYNWLSSNNITFINDPELTSFSTSEILTSPGRGSQILTEISESNIQQFTFPPSENALYSPSSPIDLGSSFGTKPSIQLTNPTFLDDLSGSISVVITAEQFTDILDSDYSGDKILIDSITPNVEGNYRIIGFDAVEEGFNGSNRLGNIAGVSADHSTIGVGSDVNIGNYFWEADTDIEINVSQALMLPLMGVAPFGGTTTLADTADNLAIGLSTLTAGQLSSFNQVIIEDGGVLTLDIETFELLDTANQSESFQSNHTGVSVFSVDQENGNLVEATIAINGSYNDFVDIGLYSPATGFATAIPGFESDASNLFEQATQGTVTAEISTSSDLVDIANFINDIPNGVNFSTNITISSTVGAEGLTAEEFRDLADLDALTSQNVIADSFPTGLTIIDSTDNIKDLITDTSEYLLDVKSSISSITSTSDANEKIQLSWEEYMGAVTGSDFVSTDPGTWTTSSTAFQNLGNIELIVTGTASELQDIIDVYGDELTNFPTGLTLNVLDGNSLTLNQSQLDKLDARIDGVVVIIDTSSAIGTLLDNAIPDSVQQITPTGNGDLEITFDQFRNLPDYFSGEVVIIDTEDNIVSALEEDLLDDRVTTLVIESDSLTLGKSSQYYDGPSDDRCLTVTAAAAANILNKKVYFLENDDGTGYDQNNFDPTEYADINIVDRGSAIANFIESASLPGTITKVVETGKINFTEKDNRSIELSYNQNLAYQAMLQSGYLVDVNSLNSEPVLAPINLQTLSEAIANVQSSLITSIESAQSSIIDNTDAAVSITGSAVESLIVAEGNAAESLIIAEGNAAESLILSVGEAAESAITAAQTSIIAEGDAAESALMLEIENAQALIINATTAITAAQTALTSSIGSAQSSIINDVAGAQSLISSDIYAAQSSLATSIESAQTSIMDDISAAQSVISGDVSLAQSVISGDVSLAQSALTTSIGSW